MTIQTQRHTQYTVFYSRWKRCRDCYDGEDAIKAGGEVYLPRIGDQDDAQYAAYKQRGRFFTAFSKSINGMVGLALRKPLIVEAPDAMQDINENVDRKGSDIRAYTKLVISEILKTDRCGTLVDYTNIPSDASLAETAGERPYWALYKAEDILDWEYQDSNLVYVVLREFKAKRGGTETTQDVRYRVCMIDDNGDYVQHLYDGDAMTFDEIIPKVNGASLKFIPFIIHSTNFDQDVAEPPLLDLANLSISHYQLKADHRHALHYVALPTPWIIGVDVDGDDDFPYTIGPQKVWSISNPDASVGMLEFSGSGVTAIVTELESMEDQMAVIGSRVLLPEVSENTATASKLRSLSETSDLASIVLIVELQMNQLLEFTASWANISGETEVNMDTNFLPMEMDASMLTAMVQAWQNGAFDHEILITNLQKAEIIPTDVDLDEMVTKVEAEGDERLAKAADAIVQAEKAKAPAAGGDE